MNAGAAASQRSSARVLVWGVVQGVGFRPFVYRLATELALDGWVRNDGQGVTAEVCGDAASITAFARRLRAEAPPRARIDGLALQGAAAPPPPGFAIVASGGGAVHAAIGPDTAVCAACLAELFDPAGRRWRHPFINCTDCGPRYTITRGLPYDRAMTTMAPFLQCARCAAEYRDPRNRRFHAEPNACPACGPRLRLLDAHGAEAGGGDVFAATLQRLRRGECVAIKGIGGFHLACDARDAGAVARLRERKGREEKPFALMAASTASLAGLAAFGERERVLLESAERPIVLLPKGEAADRILAGVAPGLACIGAMLPCAPLHWLLFHEAAGRPAGTAWLHEPQELLMVMTSANAQGEPLVTGNAEALARLAGVADAFLVHDREIATRCDDSVVRPLRHGPAGACQFVRRGRGFTPRAIPLARGGPAVLALGGGFKNTVCVLRGDEAFVSQHVGDPDNAATCVALMETASHLLALVGVRPELVAHDLHPDFFSTRHAAALAREYGARLQPVQHHLAHVAAVLAEHRIEAPALGLALDGQGLGSDGAPWGGELLLVSALSCRRIGSLAPLRLPGGDAAAREPWRMAASALHRCGRGEEITRRFPDEPAAAAVRRLLQQARHAPETSSAGRLFDAAAGLLGVRRRASFEGQAAMLLEALAARRGPVAALPGGWSVSGDGKLDLAPLLARLADMDDAAAGAALFHATLVAALADWVEAAARRHGLRTVACGGGCFLNALLARGLDSALVRRGIAVLQARQLPPNDGGLALGQAWAARLELTMEV